MTKALPEVIVSPEAKQDLIEVYQYTLQHWGQTKAEHYLSQIKQAFIECQKQPLMGVERRELFVGIRFIIVASHNIYYRFEQNRIEIVRVLHGRQDPKRHV